MNKGIAKQTKVRSVNDEWKQQRLPLAWTPTVTNPQPHREDFDSDAEFLAAHEQWLAREAKLGPQTTRRVTKAVDTEKGPRRHALAGKYDPSYETTEVEVLSDRQNMWDINLELARQQDMRALQPGASLRDVKGYAYRHGSLPDGRAIPATDTPQWRRAMADMEKRLRGELPPLDDE